MTDSSPTAQEQTRATRLEPILTRARGDMLDAGVIMEGHFRLSATEHSGHYINPQALFHQPDLSWRLAQDLIDILPPALVTELDGVAGPASGGAMIAHQVAGLLSSRRKVGQGVLFYGLTKHPDEDVQYIMPPYFAGLIRSRRILLVDDVISTGRTMKICLGEISRHGAVAVGIAAYVNRGFSRLPLGMKPYVLWDGHRSNKYDHRNCPMCQAGTPIRQF